MNEILTSTHGECRARGLKSFTFFANHVLGLNWASEKCRRAQEAFEQNEPVVLDEPRRPVFELWVALHTASTIPSTSSLVRKTETLLWLFPELRGAGQIAA